jgi:hypothetical protein
MRHTEYVLRNYVLHVWRFVSEEDIVLTGRLKPEVVKLPQHLSTMVGAMVDDVDKHLPDR